MVVPATAQWLAFSGDHHLELGGGGAAATIDDDDARFLVANVGYRYQPRDGGVLLCATFTPMYRVFDPELIPWGGVSAGWAW